MSSPLPVTRSVGTPPTTPGLTEVSEATARAEIQADVDTLQARGFPRPVSFAYPYGYWGPEEAQWVREAGYASARTTDVFTREPNPPANPFGLRVIQASLDGSEGLASLQTDVPQAAEAAPGKTWLIYLMHDFYSPIDEEIDDFLRWLQPRSANGTVVKTMGECSSRPPATRHRWRMRVRRRRSRLGQRSSSTAPPALIRMGIR